MYPGINSYLLGSEKGVAGSISDIQSVIVNGEELSINGYLDIGLIDTMHDMLVWHSRWNLLLRMFHTL